MASRRRIWQFSLRTMFALTALTALGSAVLGTQVRDYYVEQEALARLNVPVASPISIYL